MHRILLLVSCLIYLVVGKAEVAMAEVQATQLFEFKNTFIENLHMLPDGRILLTTFGSGDLWALNPKASPATIRKVATLPGSTGLSGIASLGHGRYAVSGGEHSSFNFVNGSMRVYVVSMAAEDQEGKVADSIPVADTSMMNGMVSLHNRPYVVLCADSIGGRILRIDTHTRKASVAFADAALGPGSNTTVSLGANGLKVRGDYLYFTNSAQGTFARFPIDDYGRNTGPVEVIARLDNPASITYAYDDFAFDWKGNAYVALHSSAINKITSDGIQTTFAGGSTSSIFKEPTSVALANDGESIYVSTGGNETYGGQVIQVDIRETNI
ncbi:hypothetical protein F4821DRAFT_280167 [Hypoxylon rubiginosum]|uniref:Uncharacterized protein n=1 Tax=Hypoxylon rubiginosum TaxID=110542 RepID=A0ACC0DGH1_9PEZI|nr:hypothetical protein F4821DRAFT_280167 [Hypoxylon rubiginosum]